MKKRAISRYMVCMVCFCLAYTVVSAQNNNEFEVFFQNIQSEFEDFSQTNKQQIQKFRDSIQEEFRLHRDSINARFARHLKQKWDTLPIRSSLRPPIFRHSYPFPEGNIANIPTLSPKNNSAFYGKRITLTGTSHTPLRIHTTQEESIGNAWLELSRGNPVDLICKCLIYADEMALNTWGYYKLVCHIADQLYPEYAQNEKVIFQTFILNQSGYKCRIGRSTRQELLLLIPFNEYVYNCPYLQLDGTYYYILGNTLPQGNLTTYSRELEVAKKTADLHIRKSPDLGKDKYIFKEYRLPGSKVDISLPINRHLIDFYSTYPRSDLKVYASAVTESRLNEALIAQLQSFLSKMNNRARIEWLLRFIHTNFNYQLDEKHWGYERYFFPEEGLFYPCMDCEDLAILFKYLVTHLTSCDVKLILYPEHVATAVYDKELVNGTSISHQGRKYIIYDPSYLGSKPGQLTPKVDAGKYKLQN